MVKLRESVRVTRVQLRNFKGFASFSLTLEPMTMLVGPNNAGKSTIVGAFRVLSVALRTAHSRRAQPLRFPDGNRWGHAVSPDSVPISMENAQHNYSDDDAVATFTLSNGGKLKLIFSPELGCVLIGEYGERDLRSAAEFKRLLPIDIGVVPVLGPLEHEEPQVEARTVQRNLQTHRASRNFRNYWHLSDDDEFQEFRSAVVESWDGIDILKPELDLRTEGLNILHMMCTENRITRELHWMGFGFHIWLQIITHVLRAREATILVIDEPETYMHPSLQRDLLAMLRRLDVDCLLATHSSELVAGADRSEIVLVDKVRKSGSRLARGPQVEALDILGSAFNFALADVLRQRTAILVEGDTDLNLLKQLGRRIAPGTLSGTKVPPQIPLGGFRPNKAADYAKVMKILIGDDVRLAVLLDRDYRSDAEVMSIESELKKEFQVAHVLRKKELENYFLSLPVLVRELQSRVESGSQDDETQAIEIIDRITSGMREHTESQFVAQYVEFARGSRPSVAGPTLTQEAMVSFRERWDSLEGRLAIVSGKQFLKKLNTLLQSEGQRRVTTSQLANAMKQDEIPHEIAALLRGIHGLMET